MTSDSPGNHVMCHTLCAYAIMEVRHAHFLPRASFGRLPGSHCTAGDRRNVLFTVQGNSSSKQKARELLAGNLELS